MLAHTHTHTHTHTIADTDTYRTNTLSHAQVLSLFFTLSLSHTHDTHTHTHTHTDRVAHDASVPMPVLLGALPGMRALTPYNVATTARYDARTLAARDSPALAAFNAASVLALARNDAAAACAYTCKCVCQRVCAVCRRVRVHVCVCDMSTGRSECRAAVRVRPVRPATGLETVAGSTRPPVHRRARVPVRSVV